MGIEVATMYIARRESNRGTTQFPVGTYVIARPATVSKAITGVVVATTEPYTLYGLAAHG